MSDTRELEQTLVLIKPDTLKNSLTGYVLSQLSQFHTGLRYAGAKIVHVSRMLAEVHYAEHKGKGFYESLLDYIMGRIHYAEEPTKRRVIAFIYQGTDAVLKVRNIAGPTNPHVAREKRPGCIRALGTVVPITDGTGKVIDERMDNLIHASASDAEAEREIKLWFQPSDVPPLMRAYSAEVSEDHYYFLGGKLLTRYEKGSICFIAPGEVAWTSDLEALHLLAKGSTTSEPFEGIVAKYLINHHQEGE